MVVLNVAILQGNLPGDLESKRGPARLKIGGLNMTRLAKWLGLRGLGTAAVLGLTLLGAPAPASAAGFHGGGGGGTHAAVGRWWRCLTPLRDWAPRRHAS